jgi:hypothetical protein
MNWYRFSKTLRDDQMEECEKWLRKLEPKFPDIVARYSIPEFQHDDCFQLMRMEICRAVSKAKSGNKSKFIYICACHAASEFARDVKREEVRELKRREAEFQRRAFDDKLVESHEEEGHHNGLERVAKLYFKYPIGDECDELARVRLGNPEKDNDEVRFELMFSEMSLAPMPHSTYDVRWSRVRRRIRAFKNEYYS